MRTYIITGASRGVGAAIVRALLAPGNNLFCVSRSLCEPLIAESNEAGVTLRWIQAGLSETRSIEAFMATIAERVEIDACETITLINNAAVLSPLGPVGTAQPGAVAQAVAVNLVAPIVLTNSFIRHFGGAACRRTVINVSSGAALTPMPGLSTYSATKAGLNAFTRACAAEHGADGPGAQTRFYAVSPGTVDTSMQEALRDAGPSVLPDHGMYVEWKESGALIPTDDSARAVLSLLERDDVANGSFIHYRDLTGKTQ
jgi:NAD(P)-dependent dehydrogenase (short-subunit alcohol dehydrogenase family)